MIKVLGIALWIIVFVLSGIVILSARSIRTSDVDREPAAIRVSAAPPASVPSRQVTLRKWNWHRSASGMVMLANFTIENSDDSSVHDVGIHCSFLDKNGTAIDSVEETLSGVIRAQDTRTFNDINMGFVPGRAASAACTIETPRTLPLQ